jgi:hypothetical protein
VASSCSALRIHQKGPRKQLKYISCSCRFHLLIPLLFLALYYSLAVPKERENEQPRERERKGRQTHGYSLGSAQNDAPVSQMEVRTKSEERSTKMSGSHVHFLSHLREFMVDGERAFNASERESMND